jgi:hypothetical protein
MGTGMSVALAVALLALLVAAFTLVALVAVYARVRGLEAASGDTGLSGYATLVGRPAPASVRPGPGEGCSLVAVLDGDCTLCATVFQALIAANAADDVRVVALTDRIHDPAAGPGTGILRVDVAARADLYEGYAPTVLAVDAGGMVVARRFVYADTDLPELLRELVARARTPQNEVSRA